MPGNPPRGIPLTQVEDRGSRTATGQLLVLGNSVSSLLRNVAVVLAGTQTDVSVFINIEM